MPLDLLVTAVVEISLNTLIRPDTNNQNHLARLKGKVLRVMLTDINKQLIFVFSQQIHVLTAFDGKIDCKLALRVSIIPQLKDKANLTKLITQDKLQLDGDIDIAYHFYGLLNSFNPDVTEWLSHYTGDIVAYTLARFVQQSIALLKNMLRRQQNYASELVTEEWRLAPGALEMAHFANQVDEVQSHTLHLQTCFETFKKSLKRHSQQASISHFTEDA
ncbi:ubiquinone biosynthesis accessory factor UbiJ [Candidatus Enterovibrio altilux]|uniref:Ubiquinone biosynthesis accessory factor UbiJ n=1 Tax=Candidatus Enterovibrio altilux TaxID=1927128 RepID=A0A291B8F2_9GAMM|nr:SCP2 sterol-binding domain-containing protein [Candidatus Enterovibrio luxaltus]ATF09289.1 Protein YigP [Candidatus Enterovibrio luxaltus]